MALKLSNKPSKVNYFGIEVDPEITWNGWEPGNKYTKKLILKNVKYVTQKLNFSVPAKEVFTTTFPKTITLSAGTSFCLPITFKPHKKDVFEDKIDFQTNEGEVFTVPMKALLPQYVVDIPERVSCGIVAAHDVSHSIITVQNKSQLETPYKWCFSSPYTIEPESGILQPFETMQFKISFHPKDVSTYTMNIPFLFGSRLTHQSSVTVTSIAKYPNISILLDDKSMTDIINDDGLITVDFGVVSVGRTEQKMMIVQNESDVNASIEICRADVVNPIDCVFSCPGEFMPVQAKTSVGVQLNYQPQLVLTNSVENFLIKVSNKCATFKVKCVGKSDGPSVSISHNVINFFQLNVGEQATQSIILTNNSENSSIPYQFVIDPDHSVFHIDKCSGIIKPKSDAHFVITFWPQQPIQYYRKLTCLIPDQEPIFIDILGTCHDINFRPHILTMKHLNDFRQRQVDGLSYFSPEVLMSNVAKGLIRFNVEDQLKVTNDDNKSIGESVPVLSPWKDYFFSHNDTDVVFSTPYIGQDEHSLYFDGLEYVSRSQITQRLTSGAIDYNDLHTINEKEKKISLKNNTKGTVIIHWTTIANNENSVFSIYPLVTEIAPTETVVFTVKFRPDGSDRLFGSELEAFAYFKSQRQFELVNERFISPPFCVLLRCAGHSFSVGHQPFQPRYDFDQVQVVFPSINIGETAFRSLTLTNRGDQPMLFNLENIYESFSMKPVLGHILPGMKQIFVIRCEPSSVKQFLSSVEIKLNNRNDFKQVIPVLGSIDKAIVSLDNDGHLFFNSTNIGNISTQRYSIKNTSRIPLKFEWKVRPDDSFATRVYPKSGLLLPNEILTQRWFFSPKSCGRNVVKALLMVQGISPFGSFTDSQYFPLRIIGQGEESSLEVHGPNNLEFDLLVVGSSSFQTFDLVNSKNATVYYQLFVDKDEEENNNNNNSYNYDNEDFDVDECVRIKDSKGFLPGRCKKTIYISVSPRQRMAYKLKIGYYLIDNDSVELDCMNQENESFDMKRVTRRIGNSNDKIVTVSFAGVFPTLQITDVQGSGPSQWLSKLSLWKNLSLDNFNVSLDSDPTTSELIFTMATRASFHRNNPVTTRALINMNLGAAPQNSDPTEIRLMFENCGSVETKFAFLFPEDLEIELEYWAETGEYTEEELHQMKIQDNKLFDIQPRQAIVRSGESVTVCIRYDHLVVGTDRFPILLKLDHGREILLNMTGVTLHLDRSYIHFPNNKHVFSPTPIGLLKTPIQYYDLYNAGAVPVHFELDLNPLQTLTENNYNIPILQCLNPVGNIVPGQNYRLEWIFTPIESKTYTVEIPFHISNGDCATVKFTAIGYDQRYLGDSYNPDQGLPGESGVTSIQSIVLPNQNAKLNIERISIGAVPTFSCIRRIVFLNNISSNKTITFSWNVTHTDDADHVFIYPQSGRLIAMESITCHVTLYTRSIPKFFDINLICEIYDESQINKYKEELFQWDDENKRKSVEFTISDNFRKTNQKKSSIEKPNLDNRKSSTQSLLPPVIKPAGSGLSLTKSKSSSSDRTESEMKNDNLWFKPEMPKPFFLHLGITGRSCPIDEFQKEYPKSVGKYVLDKPSLLELASPLAILQSDKENETFPVEGYSKEVTAIECVLTDIIGNIMEDMEFLDAVKNLRNESVPFYSQLPESKVCLENGRFQPENNLNSSLCDAEKIDNNDDSNQKDKEPVFEEINHSEETSPKAKLTDQDILESLSFGTMLESILENIVVNIMSEANGREVDLTSRPRLIALPPRSARNNETV